MSRSKTSANRRSRESQKPNKRFLYVTIFLLPILITITVLFERGLLSKGNLSNGAGSANALKSPMSPMQSSTPQLVKEYIYAGSRLIATKEPLRFADVPDTNPFYQDISTIAHLEVTTGCGVNGNGEPIYCLEQNVTREQMAAFIMRAMGNHKPPTPGQQRFADVPLSNVFYAYIEALYQAGVTTGCGTNGQGQLIYCPSDNVTHAQMSAFMSRAAGYPNPPEPSSMCFADVTNQEFFYKFIYHYVGRGVWPGCTPCSGSPSSGNFCPHSLVTRPQMAYILVRNFNLGS